MKKLTGPILMAGIPNICADLFYVSGFKASDPVVYLQQGPHRYLVVSQMEIGRARTLGRRLIALTPEDLGLPKKARGRLAGWAEGVLRKANARSATVAHTFPLGVARALERRGLRLRVAKEALCPGRAIKSAEEIAHLRAAQRAAAHALRHAAAMLAEARADAHGVLRLGRTVLTAEAVRKAINRVLLDDNCAGGEPIVACGPLSANPHWIGHGPLKAGEPIVFDIFPQNLETGYWGDLTRTLVKGRPSPRLAAMHRAVQKAQTRALGALRAGVRASTIHQGVVDAFERMGFKQGDRDGVPEGFIHGTGHGVGLEIHEAPSLGRQATVLRSGHVVTVEPGLYYADTGGVRIEDTVIVTRGGFEYLWPCPKTWIIA